MSHEAERFSEMIDACRRAEDLQLPDLQPLASSAQDNADIERRLQKSWRIDGQIRQAIEDVEIPDGLETRLFASLEDQAAGSVEASPAESGVAPVVRAADRRSWKTWLASAACLAACVAAALWVFSPAAPAFQSESEVIAEANYWLQHLDAHWSRAPLPQQDYPLPQRPRLPKPYSWQWGHASHASLKVVCYNLNAGAKPRTLLFVCRGAEDPQLPAQPTNQPSPSANGWQLGSWQAAEVVYVLAVEGTAAQYRDVLGRSGSFAVRVMDFARKAS